MNWRWETWEHYFGVNGVITTVGGRDENDDDVASRRSRVKDRAPSFHELPTLVGKGEEKEGGGWE